jgi:hypothetical protein
MIYNLLSIVFIIILAAISSVFILSLFLKGRDARVEFIRQFKTGNFIIAYLTAIPIYWLGRVYAGENILWSFALAVSDAVELVGWKYHMSDVAALMNDNVFYRVAIWFCYVLAASNTLLFILSIIHQKCWEWYVSTAWKASKREKLLLVGNNDENVKIYASQQKINEKYKKLSFKERRSTLLKRRSAIIVDDFTPELRTTFYAKKVNFVSQNRNVSDAEAMIFDIDRPVGEISSLEKYCISVLKPCLRNRYRKCTIIINMKSDEENISLCSKLIECKDKYLEKRKTNEAICDMLKRIKIYVFGSPEYKTIYDNISNMSKGSICYVNKYRQISMDFIDKYPLTQFMTDEQIDYKTSLVHNDVDINVAFIGFGKTNQQLFLTSVANNQFLTEENGRKILKPVHYYSFDNNRLNHNQKNLHHSFNRFKSEFDEEIKLQKENPAESKYLPLPDYPADIHNEPYDINDRRFYQRLREILCGDKKFNYVVIAFGNDLENIDMAHKMVEKKQEWGLKDTYIFVKVRNNNHNYKIFSDKKAYLIGEEYESVYNIDCIESNGIIEMAKMRNRIYNLEYEVMEAAKKSPEDVSKVDIEKVYKDSDYDWYTKKEEIERESNLYACLSLRSKLHLMGLDYCPKNVKTEEALDRDAYLAHYAGGDLPEYRTDVIADDKDIVKYTIDFAESRRKTMAIQEHLRWNSYMLTMGVVPASKEQILNDPKNGKNYTLRHHGNITTFEGLVEFRQMIAKRDGGKEEDFDKIKYDYQLLDDAHWLLESNGYKIIRREI